MSPSSSSSEGWGSHQQDPSACTGEGPNGGGLEEEALKEAELEAQQRESEVQEALLAIQSAEVKVGKRPYGHVPSVSPQSQSEAWTSQGSPRRSSGPRKAELSKNRQIDEDTGGVCKACSIS